MEGGVGVGCRQLCQACEGGAVEGASVLKVGRCGGQRRGRSARHSVTSGSLRCLAFALFPTASCFTAPEQFVCWNRKITVPESPVKVSETRSRLYFSAFCNLVTLYSTKGTVDKPESHNLQPKQRLILCYYCAITQYYITVAITILNLILNVTAHTNSMFCTICQQWSAPELEKTAATGGVVFS